jgi:FkbM family methyltransferase
MRPDALRIARIAGHSFLTAPLRPGTAVLDLGVNHGEFATEILARFGCRVFGVEPVPELFAALPLLAGLTVEQLAVTGDGEPARLYVNHTTCATIQAGLSQAGAPTVEVPGVTLAGLLDRHGLEHVALVKVDIEGAELAMVAAASDETLRRADQITIEFHDFLDPGLGGPVRDARRRLRAAGFAELAMSRDSSDVLFVNRSRIAFGAGHKLAATITQKYPRGIGRIAARRLALAAPGR